jgi:hypothetical protein
MGQSESAEVDPVEKGVVLELHGTTSSLAVFGGGYHVAAVSVSCQHMTHEEKHATRGGIVLEKLPVVNFPVRAVAVARDKGLEVLQPATYICRCISI